MIDSNIVFLNYFSVGSLIPVLFNLVVAVYFFSIPNRLKATHHLGIAFFYLTFFNLAYFIAGSFYHPLAAYHRWLTVGLIMLVQTHFNIFWCYFPEPKYPRFTKIFLFVQYAVSIAVTLVFFYATYRGATVFHFDGHYYDFMADDLSKTIGIIIMINIVVFMVLSVWRTIITKKGMRWVVVALALSNLVATIVPSITNTLSREGLMDRQIFQITWDLFTVVGYFFMTIFYINNSRDRTTLIAKIIGITLVTFLLLMQAMSYVFFEDKEKSYDTMKNIEVSYILSGVRVPDEVSYIVSIPLGTGELNARLLRGGIDLDFDELKYEYENAALYERILDQAYKGDTAGIRRVLEKSNRYSAGFKALILTMPEFTNKKTITQYAVHDFISGLNRKLAYVSRKILKTPETGFTLDQLKAFENDPSMRVFLNAVSDQIKKEGIAQAGLQKEVVKYLSPVWSEGKRIYRKSKDDMLHVVSYINYNRETDTVSEVGFLYTDYRQSMHSIALLFIIILIAVVFLIRTGYQSFLSGVLISPVRQLLTGIKHLNEGKLDFVVPVKVEDEIGYLSKTFNKMVTSLKMMEKERELAERAYRSAEVRFRGLVEQSLVGIYIIYHGRFAYVNPKCAGIFGYSQDEYLNMESALQIFDPEDRLKAKENIRKREQNEVIGIINTYRGMRKDGSIIDIEVYGSRMEIDGEPAVIGTVLDVTEKNRAMEEMVKMRSFLKNIIDSMPSVLISVDKNGKVIHWNSQAENISKISENDALGKPMEELLPLLRLMRDDVTRAIMEKRQQKVEKLEHVQNEERRYSDILVYPLISNGVEGAVIRIDDVTARVRLEEMMVQTEKMMSVGGLAAGMAHEINNPLSGILMSAQNLKRRLTNDIKKNVDAADELGISLGKIQQYMENRGLIKMIDAIEELGDRASKIVANMLSFSRRSDSKMEPRDMTEIVDKAVELAQHDYDLKKRYDFRHIEIVKDYEQGLPQIHCVETEIEQVLLNLLKNSAHSMGDKDYKEERPKLTLRIKKEHAMVAVTVEDNGPGIEKNVFKHIFEPFFTTKKAGVGTGLGLSVSYHIIVNNHKGQMTAESEPGKGAAFIIKLPISIEL